MVLGGRAQFTCLSLINTKKTSEQRTAGGTHMADHSTTLSEPGPESPALSSHHTLTRRGLLGGAGIAVGGVLASPTGMPAITPAAAQAASADPRPLDAAMKRRALEVRQICAANNEKIPIAPHPTNGDEARYTNKIGSDTRGPPHDKRGEVESAAWQALYTACQSGDPADFEKIPLGGTRKIVNPVGTLAVSFSGITPTQIGIPPSPALASAERVARRSRYIGKPCFEMFRLPSCATTPPIATCLPPSRKSTSFPTSGDRRLAGGSHPVLCSVPTRFISTRRTRRVVPSHRQVFWTAL